MKAIPLPFYKRRLMEVSKELYLTHQWEMPQGLIDQSLRNPLNFTRAEWQQARRIQHDPRLIKAMFQNCWERSDSAGALQNALEEHGYFLARGDRRGHVVVDFRGAVYALARWAGVKTKEVRARLGDPKELPGVEEIRGRIAERMTDQLRRYVQEVDTGYRKLEPSAEFKRLSMVQRHRDERASAVRACPRPSTKKPDRSARARTKAGAAASTAAGMMPWSRNSSRSWNRTSSPRS